MSTEDGQGSWTWQQALLFLVAFSVVCGPWFYMMWEAANAHP